ncbi:MAG: DUF2007 domain-containing protein [Halioglobus sp.]|nr:DUF2007 domain-containing protein [Halioglobus sp.]
MRKLFESPSIVDLRLLANYLEHAGIRVEILNEHQGGSPGVPHWGLSVWAELWVREPAQYARAETLLAQYRREQSVADVGEWQCSACGEANPETFDTCWHCAAPAKHG